MYITTTIIILYHHVGTWISCPHNNLVLRCWALPTQKDFYTRTFKFPIYRTLMLLSTKYIRKIESLFIWNDLPIFWKDRLYIFLNLSFDACQLWLHVTMVVWRLWCSRFCKVNFRLIYIFIDSLDRSKLQSIYIFLLRCVVHYALLYELEFTRELALITLNVSQLIS